MNISSLECKSTSDCVCKNFVVPNLFHKEISSEFSNLDLDFQISSVTGDRLRDIRYNLEFTGSSEKDAGIRPSRTSGSAGHVTCYDAASASSNVLFEITPRLPSRVSKCDRSHGPHLYLALPFLGYACHL